MERLPAGTRIFTLLYANPRVVALREYDSSSIFEYAAPGADTSKSGYVPLVANGAVFSGVKSVGWRAES